MDDTEFNRILQRTYAQVVLNALLDAQGYCYAFSELRDEVNAIITDDSRGAKELNRSGMYSPASLNSLLSAAENANLITHYLSDDGQKRWKLCRSQLSQSQIDTIRSRNSTHLHHDDSARVDLRAQAHTDSSS